MTIRHLKIFCAVCDNDNNTTKAAVYLNMTQPAVSLAIKELESYYGVRLFDRINKRLFITAAGENFLSYAKRISNMFEDMETSIKNWDYFGKLRVGANITVGTHFMSEYVQEFSRLYPDVEVDVFVAQKSILIDKLIDNQLDFALIESPNTNPTILAEEYMRDSLVVVCYPGMYPEGTTISVDEFLKHNLLLRNEGSAAREVFDTVCKQNNLNPKIIWQSTSTAALVNAAKEKIGLAVLPYHMVRSPLSNGKISIVNVDGLDFSRKYYIYVHKDKYLSKSAKAFIEICKNSEINIPPEEYISVD